MADLGFLITRPPHASPGARSFFLLAQAALDGGHAVRAFFYLDGVYQCLKGQRPALEGEDGPGVWMEALLARGASMVASNMCLRIRGLDLESVIPGIRVGTMEELASLTAQADRVVCL